MHDKIVHPETYLCTMERSKGSPDESTLSLPGEGKDLILFNDEVNTFDFVIETLVEVCDHSPEQAEQCAWIAHFKGKCPVKSGDEHSLNPYFNELSSRGLTVSIE